MRLHACAVLYSLPILAASACAANPRSDSPVELHAQLAALTDDVEIEVKELGKAELVPMPPPEVLAAEQLARAPSVRDAMEPVSETADFIEVQLETGLVLNHTFSRKGLRELLETYAAQGLNGERLPQDENGVEAPPTPPKPSDKGARMIQKTWSDGVDNRFRMGIADGWPILDNYLAPIGRITSGSGSCTGAFVGRRVIMTAAHCLVASSTTNGWTAFSNLQITPRADTTQSNTAPYRTQGLIALWVPAEYWNGTCSGEGACNKFDIGFAAVSDTFNGHPGWFGWNSNLTNTEMGDSRTYMEGYPGCSVAAPAGCTAGTLYGDENTDCDVGRGQNFSNDANGQSREMRFKCDGSPGMSGSPIYTASTPNCANGGKCVYGQYNQYLCTGSGCMGQTYVNTMGRLTITYASLLAWLNTTYR